MENNKTLSERFDLLRQLPLEVSFEQVEQWLNQQVVFEKENQSSWWQWIKKWGGFQSDN